ncbi:Nuclease associated modular domain 3 [uncultured Caudovirales phage]|uniref:Nuclease associated modular domain 3 n=1 Tax=uncultured Caudovirales phage TaxID=2100421 RepID=A0A6J5KMV8_9CAUD|nr:Nuclease associated modular domain 3 [uncultured Caudovirales phage]
MPDKSTYTESHHIIPECFYKKRSRKGRIGWLHGDPNDPSNLVRLTIRQHLLAHWLLTKMTTGSAYHKMIKAFYSMMNLKNDYQSRYRYPSRVYQHSRLLLIQSLSEQMLGENNPMFGKKHSEESKQKMSISRKGRRPWNKDKQMNNEFKLKISNAMIGENNPMFGKKHSDETKSYMSKIKYGNPNIKLQGREKTKEHKQKLSDINKEFLKSHIAMNNNQKTIFITHDRSEEYLNNGWHMGYAPKGPQKNPNKKRKCWVKKDTICLKIDYDNLDTYKKDGWVRGRII